LAAGATTSDRSVSQHARCPVVCPACTDAYSTCRRAGNSDNEHVRTRRRCQQGRRVNSYEGCCCDLHACQYCHLLKAVGNSNGSRGCHARQPLICIPACALSTDMACMHCRWRHARMHRPWRHPQEIYGDNHHSNDRNQQVCVPAHIDGQWYAIDSIITYCRLAATLMAWATAPSRYATKQLLHCPES
jgi:hypothetical protein